MHVLFVSFILISIMVNAINTSSSVAFIKKCYATDFECWKESANAAIPTFVAGIPELGVHRLDPLYFDKMDASSPGLTMLATNMTVTGLKKCIIDKINHDVTTSKFYLSAMCTINIESIYDVAGNVIVVPIVAKGKGYSTIRKILYDIEADVHENLGKDGKKHWVVKNYKYKYSLNDKADIVLKNIFGVNKVLSDVVQQLFSKNSNEIVLQLGIPIVKKIVEYIVKDVNNMFHVVPLEDLIIY